MADFTKGPWRVISSKVHIVSDNGPGNVVVCRTGFSWFGNNDFAPQSVKRWEADANLISAAPDLYDSVIALLEQLYHDGVPVDKDHPKRFAVEIAEAAISKADGK